MLAQFCGGVLGGITVSALTSLGNCGCPSGMADESYSVLIGAIHETICSFFLMLCYMALSVDFRAARDIYGFGIGSCLAVCI